MSMILARRCRVGIDFTREAALNWLTAAAWRSHFGVVSAYRHFAVARFVDDAAPAPGRGPAPRLLSMLLIGARLMASATPATVLIMSINGRDGAMSSAASAGASLTSWPRRLPSCEACRFVPCGCIGRPSSATSSIRRWPRQSR